MKLVSVKELVNVFENSFGQESWNVSYFIVWFTLFKEKSVSHASYILVCIFASLKSRAIEDNACYLHIEGPRKTKV